MRLVAASLVVVVAATGLRAQPATPPSLDTHLAGWEQAMKATKSLTAKYDMTRTDAVFKKERKFTGSFALLKPNRMRLDIESTANKNDREEYICDGKSIFEYNLSTKTVTEIPSDRVENDNLMFDLLGGMTAAAAKKRYTVTQFKPEAEHYIYLDIKPTLAKDKQEFELLRMALFAPKIAPPNVPYQLAQLYVVKPNGDSEKWTFRDLVLNPKELKPEEFEFKDPGKGWQIRKAMLRP